MSKLARFAAAAALVQPLVLAPSAGAQGAAAPGAGGPAAAGAAPAMVTAANAARLKPGRWTYVTRLMGAGPPNRLGFRTLELREATYGGAPAWRLVDSRQLATVTLADTLYLSRSDLTPLHRAMHAPGSDATTDFARDSIRATFGGEEGEAHAALAAEPRVLANLYLLEALVAVSPLDAAWRGSARLAAIGRDGAGIVPIVLRTTGEERVPIPDGPADCWVLSLDVGKGGQRLWVRKSDGVVVKERIPVMGMANTELELLLAEHGVQK